MKITAARLIRRYNKVNHSIDGERDAACPAGLVRILNSEPWQQVGILAPEYWPFTIVVTNAYGLYAISTQVGEE